MGGLGDDTLVGGAGADTLVGGLGDDGYRVDDLGDSVVETGGLPMALPRANAKTLAAIKAAKAGKATKVSLDDL